MKILVGSTNPVKIEATRLAFSPYFSHLEVNGMAVDGGVVAQPIGNDTYVGAENRAKALFALNESERLMAHYFVGIEGGIMRLYEQWFAFGIVCVMNQKGKVGFGSSPHFQLPHPVVADLLTGIELGDVMDQITGEENVKQSYGAIGYFSRGVISRTDLYVQGVTMALVPFLNEDHFFNWAETGKFRHKH